MKTYKEFALKVKESGGRLYFVGGKVRDFLRNIDSKDDDLCATGFDRESFLAAFPEAQQVIGQNGESTVEVFLVEIGGVKVEVALAREEVKVGKGYHGFEFISTKDTTIEKDLFRRDLTINAIAMDVLTGEYVDPFGGRKDIKDKILRATSDAFYEDPLRVYRVAVRYAKDLGYTVEERTKEMMKKAALELNEVKPERVVEELKKALLAPRPDKFFRLLQELNILSVHFPFVSNLHGVPQPSQFHPEGDVFEHTMLTLLAMRKISDRYEDLFSILVHDLGKTLTPIELLPKHLGHEEAGLSLVEKMCNFLGVPTTWKKAAMFATANHGKFHRLGNMRDIKIVDLLVAAERTPLKVEGFAKIALADARGKLNPDALHPYYDFAMNAITEIQKVKGNPSLQGKQAGEDKRVRQAAEVKKLKLTII